MLRFGVSRGQGGPALLESARQFADALSTALRDPMRLVVARDYDHLLAGTLEGGIDVAWMPPLVHSRATAEGALLAAVSERGGTLTYRSALVTRADSGYLNVRSLHGARAAWSDPSSAGGYLFPSLHLAANGIERRELASEKFYGSPRAACAAVAEGEAEVCACFVSEAAAPGGVVDRARALSDVERVFAGAGERLRVLDVTDSIPPDGVVLGAHVDGARQARARDALLGLHQRRAGQAALAALLQAERLAPVTETVRKTIERLLERVRAR